MQPGRRCTINATQYGVELIAAGQLSERFWADRVKGDIDAGQPGFCQRLGAFFQPDAVRRDRKRHLRVHGVNQPNNIHQVGANQRFTAGEPDLLNTELTDRDIG